jgi:hypothetical protein
MAVMAVGSRWRLDSAASVGGREGGVERVDS